MNAIAADTIETLPLYAATSPLDPRLLIAFYSPATLLKTQLRVGTSDKSQGNGHLRRLVVHSLGRVFSSYDCEKWACFADFAAMEARVSP
jgi:hypothetical protein